MANTGTELILFNSSAPPVFAAADFTEDGLVNGADLTAWKTGYGTAPGATHGDGDANSDGAVGGFDFLVWQRQFGAGGPATPTIASVPEPGAIGLALLAVVGAATRLRKR